MVSSLLTRFSTTGGRPIFCHFLNRELHDSLSGNFNAPAYLETIRLCSIFHSEPLFCNLSQLCEAAYQDRGLMEEIGSLTKADIFLPYSDFDRVEEFLASRHRLYEHDQARYGLYFSEESNTFFAGVKPARVETGNTTKFIADAIKEWQPGRSGYLSDSISLADVASLEPLANDLRRITERRGGRAMTAALFRTSDLVSRLNPVTDGAIRRSLTALYVKHYLTHFRALTVPDLPGLHYYEQVHSEPMLSYRLLRSLGKGTGIVDFLLDKERFGLQDRIDDYYSIDRYALHIATGRLSVVARGLVSPNLQAPFDWTAMPGIAQLVLTEYMRLPDPRRVHSYRDALAVGAQRTNAVCTAIASKDDQAASLLKEHDQGRLRLLITTATDIEDRVLMKVFERERMYLPFSDFTGRSSIRYLGLYGGVNLYHVRSSAGGAGQSGAQAVVAEAIQRLNPHMVISCGICAGLNPKQQKLEEIVISTVVRHYDAARINEEKWWQPLFGTNIVPRGSRPDASALLLDRVRDLLLSWHRVKVHQGIVMSGDKLVDNRRFRARLLRIEPEAIACEMEGVGITSEAERHRLEWLIVKGICDFAAAKTKDYQGQAADNAFSFLAALIKRGGLNAAAIFRT